ncbi:MAG TPA: hypothetical protein VMJ64_10150 [Anaerolineales bacterium]|nr:hypothetical protein [Anaerolineales bacterium]
MTFQELLEIVLGLVLVYYVLAAIVSTITKILTEAFETRGAALQTYLNQMLGDKSVDLTNLPQIKALRPIRYSNWWNVFGAGTEEKKVEKIPYSTLVDAFFDVTGLTCNADIKPTADELTAIVNRLPPSEGRQALLDWIQQGVTDIDQLRGRVTDYTNGILNQAQLTFKARARSLVIILSIILTLLFGTDTIQLAKDLAADAQLRALLDAQASRAAAGVNVTGNIPDLTSLINKLSASTVQFAWWQQQRTPTDNSAQGWIGFVLLKFLGLGITAIAVSQGSSFWYDVIKRISGQTNQPPSDGG